MYMYISWISDPVAGEEDVPSCTKSRLHIYNRQNFQKERKNQINTAKTQRVLIYLNSTPSMTGLRAEKSVLEKLKRYVFRM